MPDKKALFSKKTLKKLERDKAKFLHEKLGFTKEKARKEAKSFVKAIQSCS